MQNQPHYSFQSFETYPQYTFNTAAPGGQQSNSQQHHDGVHSFNSYPAATQRWQPASMPLYPMHSNAQSSERSQPPPSHAYQPMGGAMMGGYISQPTHSVHQDARSAGVPSHIYDHSPDELMVKDTSNKQSNKQSNSQSSGKSSDKTSGKSSGQPKPLRTKHETLILDDDDDKSSSGSSSDSSSDSDTSVKKGSKKKKRKSRSTKSQSNNQTDEVKPATRKQKTQRFNDVFTDRILARMVDEKGNPIVPKQKRARKPTTVAPELRAERSIKHNEAEVRRRQRLNNLLLELAMLIGCRKPQKSAILKLSIERINEWTSHITDLEKLVDELSSQLDAILTGPCCTSCGRGGRKISKAERVQRERTERAEQRATTRLSTRDASSSSLKAH